MGVLLGRVASTRGLLLSLLSAIANEKISRLLLRARRKRGYGALGRARHMSDDDIIGMFSFLQHLATLGLLRDAGARVMLCLAHRWDLVAMLDDELLTDHAPGVLS